MHCYYFSVNYHFKRFKYWKTSYVYLLNVVTFLMLFVPLWKCFIWYPFPSNLRTSFSITYSSGLLMMIFFRFYISKNHFILPSFLKSIFVEYRILGWHYFSLKMLLHCILTCLDSREIWSSLPMFLCIKCDLFSLSTFKVLSYFTSLEQFNYDESWSHFLNVPCA